MLATSWGISHDLRLTKRKVKGKGLVMLLGILKRQECDNLVVSGILGGTLS